MLLHHKVLFSKWYSIKIHFNIQLTYLFIFNYNYSICSIWIMIKYKWVWATSLLSCSKNWAKLWLTNLNSFRLVSGNWDVQTCDRLACMWVTIKGSLFHLYMSWNVISTWYTSGFRPRWIHTQLRQSDPTNTTTSPDILEYLEISYIIVFFFVLFFETWGKKNQRQNHWEPRKKTHPLWGEAGPLECKTLPCKK